MKEILGYLTNTNWFEMPGAADEQVRARIAARDVLEAIIADVLSESNRIKVLGPLVRIDDGSLAHELTAHPPFETAAEAAKVAERIEADMNDWLDQQPPALACCVDTFVPRAE